MDSQTLISTASIPPEFLKATFMVGHIPFKALATDPRISYKLYIPSEHYNPNPKDPTHKLPLLPLVVGIHGTGRNASDVVSRLVPFAHSSHFAVLAPFFPAGLDGPNDLDSYKVLSSKTLRSDLALLSILEEVSQRFPGISTTKIYLTGFSGGGQFAHRFFYLYPSRLHAVSVGAPGRVTRLDPSLAWPEGISNLHEKFGKSISHEEMKEVKVQMVVGEEDNVVHGGEAFWEWAGKMKGKSGAGESGEGKLARMRVGRLETLRELCEEWKGVGVEVRFDVVPGVAHDSAGVFETVLKFLAPLITPANDRENI